MRDPALLLNDLQAIDLDFLLGKRAALRYGNWLKNTSPSEVQPDLRQRTAEFPPVAGVSQLLAGSDIKEGRSIGEGKQRLSSGGEGAPDPLSFGYKRFL